MSPLPFIPQDQHRKAPQTMEMQREVRVGSAVFGKTNPIVLIAGPCQLQTRDHALFIAQSLKELTDRLNIGFIFKTSFDKANRTSARAQRGIGFEQSLPIFKEIRDIVECPIVTDVHLPEQCEPISKVVDMLQIPAFLSRQTDLLRAAALTQKPLHIKKGQFMAPWDMQHVVKKVDSFGNSDIVLCERGVSFGYNTLVSDMRALPILQKTGCPVVFDATHSVQQPGGQGETSGGEREHVPVLARAAVAVGVSGVFIETHEDPDSAPSDGPNMVPLSEMETLLSSLRKIDALIKGYTLS